MTRFWTVAVVAAAGIFFLADCGGEAREAPSDPGARDPYATNEVVSGSKPLESTLTLGRRTETGVLGTYCWESVSGASEAFAGCTDTAGIPIDCATLCHDLRFVAEEVTYRSRSGLARAVLCHCSSFPMRTY